ncbi:MAG: peptide-methionine (S)-S-oxide reductase MsrA [Actinomycetota bacterium]|nr:peptide-methionine (S)-S-oxide reductase MsrA [Actinomycetota bacterium]MDG2121263.1 peptide-methionine (S)-S-oxide reductase MsrA [Actinomycetota bacterium]
MVMWNRKIEMPDEKSALPGRSAKVPVPESHEVLGVSMTPPFDLGTEIFVVGMGCFWGAERVFWEADGVKTTAVGYVGGFTENPSYEEVCSGLTGHNEVVLVAFDPEKTSFSDLMRLFWENHDPTQGMRQGNDLGTQYRSGIYVTSDSQKEEAQSSLRRFQRVLDAAGYGPITTEVEDLGAFYYAEHYHQQYLHKVPNGYCGMGGTGLTCPVGLNT